MANIDMTKGTATGKGRAALYAKPVYTAYALIDLVKATTAKGSVLAAADTIQAIRVPPGTRVLSANAKVLEVADVGTLNFSLGTQADSARYLSAFTGSMSVATFQTSTYGNTYTLNAGATTFSINITVGTYTGTSPTTGVVAVFATLEDLSEFAGSNINATTNLVGVPQA